MKNFKSSPKYYRKITSQDKDNNTTNNIVKLVGIFSAFTGVFASLIYIAGKYYAFGYYKSMNIPEHLLTFSINEYSAAAWFPIFIYPILLLLFGSAGLYLIVLFVNFIFKIKFIHLLINWIKTKISIPNRHPIISFYEHFSRMVFLLSLLALIVTIEAGYMFSLIKEQGEKNGQTALLENSQKIRIKSLSSSNFAKSDDFYLITKNSGKYYLFKELNPDTCKPMEIFIIDESSIDQVILYPLEDISTQCNH